MSLLTRRKLTRLLATVSLVLLLFVIFLMRNDGESELLKVLQDLQRTQIQNMVLLTQERNGGDLYSFNESYYNTSDETTDDRRREITRKLFDGRPGSNASKMAAETHPFFPGYIIENPDVCSGENVDILLYIQSAAENGQSRRKIRESWASPRTFLDINLKLVFILGKLSDGPQQYKIEAEYAAYSDIVQGDFIDTFKNLTYKAVTMLAWANAHCPQVHYVAKADDDMFVDMYRVVFELLPKLYPKTLAVACDVKRDLEIQRDPGSRWYVSEDILPGEKFWPQFCSGYFAVLTGETIPKLYEASFSVEYFVPVDDAYLFGLLAHKNLPLEYVDIHNQISPNEIPVPEEELIFSGRFKFISFRVKSHDDHPRMWSLRSNKLSPWERAHSGFISTFRKSQQRPVVLL